VSKSAKNLIESSGGQGKKSPLPSFIPLSKFRNNTEKDSQIPFRSQSSEDMFDGEDVFFKAKGFCGED
jgi:hypothetical protein